MPQRIIFPEKDCVELQSYDPLRPGPNDVHVKTHYSLMSIGTETIILHQRYDPDTHFARIFSFPQLKTGVQAVGEVQSCGSDVSDFNTGDRVFMRMAHGSHQTLAAEQCSLVPSGIELKDACWCGLAKTAFRAAWAAEPLQGATVLVIGAGPVGQMAIRWLAARGAGRILVADFSEYRLQHAKRGGADTLFAGDISCHAKEIQRVDDGKGPSIVIDTTGNPKAFVHAMDAAARFGKIILLGDTGYPDRQHLSSAMMSKGLTVQATHDNHDRDGWTQRRIDEEFFGLVTDGKFDPGGLISHELSPKQCKQAYDIAENDRDNAMGILFDWSLLP